jgi:hypothetical protein
VKKDKVPFKAEKEKKEKVASKWALQNRQNFWWTSQQLCPDLAQGERKDRRERPECHGHMPHEQKLVTLTPSKPMLWMNIDR